MSETPPDPGHASLNEDPQQPAQLFLDPDARLRQLGPAGANDPGWSGSGAPVPREGTQLQDCHRVTRRGEIREERRCGGSFLSGAVRTTSLAPSTGKARRCRLPHPDMLGMVILSPYAGPFRTTPGQTAGSLPFRNAFERPIPATIGVAVFGPMPSICDPMTRRARLEGSSTRCRRCLLVGKDRKDGPRPPPSQRAPCRNACLSDRSGSQT